MFVVLHYALAAPPQQLRRTNSANDARFSLRAVNDLHVEDLTLTVKTSANVYACTNSMLAY